MMTWRSITGAARVMKVWILPNGWIVTTDGRVYRWAPSLPGVAPDPDGGFDSTEERLRISLIRSGDADTVEYRTRRFPERTGLDHIDRRDGDLVLVGSDQYARGSGDVRLFRKDSSATWYADIVEAGTNRGLIVGDLGAGDNGGDLHPRMIGFDPATYPGRLQAATYTIPYMYS